MIANVTGVIIFGLIIAAIPARPAAQRTAEADATELTPTPWPALTGVRDGPGGFRAGALISAGIDDDDR